MFSDDALSAAHSLLDVCRRKKLMLATAESCTGGLVAGLLTEIAGSSDVFERGFVTYSNSAKAELLGIAPELIARHGAVSPEVAIAMADGVLAHSSADLAVGITGIAGPGGGSADKPVGLVYIGFARTGQRASAQRFLFPADSRAGVRRAAVGSALNLLADMAEGYDVLAASVQDEGADME